jgi:hypothetical protein
MTENFDEMPDTIPISADRLLAAILYQIQEIDIQVENILADYSEYQVAVEQVEDGVLNFALVKVEEDVS